MNKIFLFLILLCVATLNDAMLTTSRVIDVRKCETADEPIILDIIRSDRAALINSSHFDEVAMINRKSLTPEDPEKDNTLLFNVLIDFNSKTILGFAAHDITVPNTVYVAFLVIDEKYRKQGLESRLLNGIVSRIRAAAQEPVTIWTYIAKNNDKLRHIWERVSSWTPKSTLHFEEGSGEEKDSWIVHLK